MMDPLHFLFALPVVCGLLLVLVLRAERRRQFVQRRLHSLTTKKDEDEPALHLTLQRRIRRAASPSGLLLLYNRIKQWIDAAFEATGNRIGVVHLIAAGLISSIIVIPFADRILTLNPAIVTMLGLMAAAAGPILTTRISQMRYQNRFLDIFPDALDLVGRGVKAGLPVNEALVVAGREIADPVGSEFRRTLEQVQIGVEMVDALQKTADRVRVADFRFMVVALALQAKTGGSLAETLANLSAVIRARKALRLKARALSSEAKASGAVLAVLPFIVGGAMWVMNHDLVRPLFTDARGRFMIGIAFLSLLVGLSTMAVMVKRAVR